MSIEHEAFESVDLIVWSGTGNTRHVAERIAGTAGTLGASARVLSSIPADDARPIGRRLLGFLAPTHGFTAPWPLWKAALMTPGVRGTDVFVLVTRGGTRVGRKLFSGFEGTATCLPAAILAIRGARIRGVGAIDMPLNWTVIHPAFGPESVSAIVSRGDTQTDAFATRILGGQAVFGGLPQLALGLLILPLSLGYMLIARLMLAKMFFADENCTSCGTCEKICPQGAVRLRGAAGRPYWTFHCQNCMRCMSNCPTEAIQGSQSWMLLYIWLSALPFGAVAAAFVLDALNVPAGFARGLVEGLSGYAWTVATVWLGYTLLWMGLLVPGVRFALSRATFTRFYRRYRGPTDSGYSTQAE
ncbi:MAG: EFR1 family ferrodoxin [Actinomycetota bacterium]|jgi:ferredoxin|nr:EFR1 family ferrodoxin [Actinomycetota bacterium]